MKNVKLKKKMFLTWPNMALTKHGIKDQKLVSSGGRPNRGQEEKREKKRKRKRRRREEKRKAKPKRYGTLYRFVWNY